jgi:UDP-N-acetylmuramoylalanine--D-glutamate ligase
MNRGLDFTKLGQYISQSPIRNLVLFPDSGSEIKQALSRDVNILETTSMVEAVAFAKAHTRKGGVVLLSSASPSYNLFKNHEDKSKQFIAAIQAAI